MRSVRWAVLIGECVFGFIAAAGIAYQQNQKDWLAAGVIGSAIAGKAFFTNPKKGGKP